jgi:hypothetical protein
MLNRNVNIVKLGKCLTELQCYYMSSEMLNNDVERKVNIGMSLISYFVTMI